MALLPEVPTSAIIIVGAGCAALILVLTSVLLYFCCKRPSAQYKEMAQQSTTQRPPASSVPQYQTSDGKPYALVPPHPSAASSTATSGRAPADSRRSSLMKETTDRDHPSAMIVMETSGDRRSSVFATLRSAHNPLDSSTSNPALFSGYSHEDCTDDNRNTDPYGFEGHYSGRQQPKRVVYEVVV